MRFSHTDKTEEGWEKGEGGKKEKKMGSKQGEIDEESEEKEKKEVGSAQGESKGREERKKSQWDFIDDL